MIIINLLKNINNEHVHIKLKEISILLSPIVVLIFVLKKRILLNMRCVGSYIQGIYLNFNLMHFILKSIRLRYASSLNSLKIPKK
jgi:hypothetical protein